MGGGNRVTRLRSNAFADPIRGLPALELPLLVRSEALDEQPVGHVEIKMTLISVVPASTGSDLSHTWTLTASSRVPDTFVTRLGFNARRLKRLGLVPPEVVITNRTVTRDCPDPSREKAEREIFNHFKTWLAKQDLRSLVAHLLTKKIRAGRVSRFTQSES